MRLLKLSDEIKKILLIFLSWKLLLIIVSVFAINFIPLNFTDRFLGGGPIIFKTSPHLFSWANFDGEHYLSISLYGYKSLEQAFFPVFPILISILAYPFSQAFLSGVLAHTIVGLLIANTAFLLALFYLFELVRIDYTKKIAFYTIFFMILFPTSFFFGSLYNESLFLLFVVLAFLNARKGNWLAAGLFGAVASATRVFGVLLLPALFIEAYQSRAKLSKYFWILLIPVGLICYMVYQYISVGDAFAFYHLQTIVGSQHQEGIVLLPQVYFRYLKILLSFDILNPIFQTVCLEFLTGIAFFILPIIGYFKKIRLSYLIYAFFGFLIPTIQGSFSSTPRYVIVLFPSFLVISLIFSKFKLLKILLLIISAFLLIIEATFFLRGYFVA